MSIDWKTPCAALISERANSVKANHPQLTPAEALAFVTPYAIIDTNKKLWQEGQFADGDLTDHEMDTVRRDAMRHDFRRSALIKILSEE